MRKSIFYISLKIQKIFLKNYIIQKSYFKKLDNYLTLSNKTKKIFSNNNYPKKKMVVIGKLKLNFLKFIYQKNFQTKKQKKKNFTNFK